MLFYVHIPDFCSVAFQYEAGALHKWNEITFYIPEHRNSLDVSSLTSNLICAVVCLSLSGGVNVINFSIYMLIFICNQEEEQFIPLSVFVRIKS